MHVCFFFKGPMSMNICSSIFPATDFKFYHRTASQVGNKLWAFTNMVLLLAGVIIFSYSLSVWTRVHCVTLKHVWIKEHDYSTQPLPALAPSAAAEEAPTAWGSSISSSSKHTKMWFSVLHFGSIVMTSSNWCCHHKPPLLEGYTFLSVLLSFLGRVISVTFQLSIFF